ncbi:DUF58 domain-containing protein [Bifidobacterium gallicum]|nr:DUF58 domain-containing protein [Bifidobacterium gallicum]EFA22964.1 hypothetical protein BIFGAL_03067 [Bifidobacterium gallicum DSM 20093 = LMG 11596]
MRRLHRLHRHIRRWLRAYVSPLGWATLALAIMLWVTFGCFGWHELLAAAIVCTVMLLAALVMSLGNTAFDATISVSQLRVSINDEVNVQVDVRNPGSAPTASARADLPMGDMHERFNIPMLGSHQSKHTSVSFKAVTRAVLPVGPLMIRKGDPFGLMRHEHKLAQRVTVFIHPDIVILDRLHAGIPRDLEGNPSGDIVDDDLDFYGLREYEPGDDVRNVHWLSSAKTRTLMIRQFEATRRTDTSITCDVNPDDYPDSRAFELAVSVHASLGVQALREGRPLYMNAGSTHVKPANPTQFLDQCSAIEPDFQDERNLVRGALMFTPDASFYAITVGAFKPLDDIRHMVMALPAAATCLVVQVAPGAPRALHVFPEFTLATVGSLDDLPPVMGALR